MKEKKNIILQLLVAYILEKVVKKAVARNTRIGERRLRYNMYINAYTMTAAVTAVAYQLVVGHVCRRDLQSTWSFKARARRTMPLYIMCIYMIFSLFSPYTFSFHVPSHTTHYIYIYTYIMTYTRVYRIYDRYYIIPGMWSKPTY